MSHLQDAGMGYFRHLKVAICNVMWLCYSALILLIHAFFPDSFQTVTSSKLKQILQSMPPVGDRILIRFNTKFADDEQKRLWRVLTNGTERLAKKVYINTNGQSIEEPVDGIQKYHIMCIGRCDWDGDNVRIS